MDILLTWYLAKKIKGKQSCIMSIRRSALKERREKQEERSTTIRGELIPVRFLLRFDFVEGIGRGILFY